MYILHFIHVKHVLHVSSSNYAKFYVRRAETLAQPVKAFAQEADGWMFKTQPRQTYVVKTGSDSSDAKSSALDVSVTGPLR